MVNLRDKPLTMQVLCEVNFRSIGILSYDDTCHEKFMIAVLNTLGYNVRSMHGADSRNKLARKPQLPIVRY